MPVNTPTPIYTVFFPLWTKMSATTAGEEAVKKAGPRYLPKLTGQSDPAYDAYKMRAMFYGATGRTVLALTGLVHRKPADIVFPDSQKDLLKTISAEGSSFDVVMKDLTFGVISTGRVGMYVDAAPESDTPYISLYRAENIINWQTIVIEGKTELKRVVLLEHVTEEDPGDAYTPVEVLQYRDVALEQRPRESESDEIQYQVVVTLWQKSKDKDKSKSKEK